MGRKKPPLAGIHFVPRKQAGGEMRWHVYAWRGGPPIMVSDQLLKPSLTHEAVVAYNTAHSEKAVISSPHTFGDVVDKFMLSADYSRLSDGTKRNWRGWIARTKERFGDAPLTVFSDKRMRGKILDWRDEWRDSPRQADYAIQVLKRILSWGVERGLLMHNPASRVSRLYKADRSEIIWEDTEIEAVTSKMKPHVAAAFKLAAWTGLARGDLLTLDWSEVNDLYISHNRSRTGVKQTIPLFDETRELLKSFHPRRQKGAVVTNRRGKPFTPRGFAVAVERARKEAGVAKGKTLHDLRGTFATRLMKAGYKGREIDAILGWETGKSRKIRDTYINRQTVAMAGINRMRKSQTNARLSETDE